MEAIEKKRRLTKLCITRLKDSMNKLTKEKILDIENLSKLEAMMLDYRNMKETFQNETEEIIMGMDENSEGYGEKVNQLLKELDEVKNIGFTCEGKIKTFHRLISNEEARNSLLPPTNSADLNASFRIPHSSNQPKLERIAISSFDGDILKFHSFRGLFENLVHNNTDLSNVQRLYYLKQALTGAAKPIVRDFELEDPSYPQAWAYILSRFDNKRAVVRALFRQLHNIKRIKADNQIRALLDEVDVILRGLTAAGEQIGDTFSRYIAYHVTLCLDESSAKDWEHSLSTTDSYPTFTQLQKFLQVRAFAIEDRAADESAQKLKKDSSPKQQSLKSFATTKKVRPKCVVCNQLHYLFQCSEFTKKKPEERFEIVKKNRLCIMCFNPHHSVGYCRSRPCPRCGNRHNSLLHFDSVPKNLEIENKNSLSSTPIVEDKAPISVAVNCATEQKISEEVIIPATSLSNIDDSLDKVILLPSAVVKFQTNGILGKARVLLDNCSQPTIMSDEFVKKHNLPTFKSQSTTSIKGVGQGSYLTKDSVNLTLMSRVEPFELNIEALVVPKSAMAYTVNFVQSSQFNYRLKNLPLADPALYRKSTNIEQVDIILSAEYYEQCVRNETLALEKVTLRLTRFGWTVVGPVCRNNSESSFSGFTACTTLQIDQNLKKFWEVEEDIIQQSSLNDRCVAHFEETFSIAEDGKFVVKLPFKESRTLVANNRERAIASLFRVEKNSSKTLKTAYNNFLEEYEQLGHMSPAGPTEETTYYIPHRAVVRTESTTTPVRVVFNASSKGRGEKSLNDLLMTGPSIQRDLFSLIIAMRTFTLLFSGDVAKMYRMIWMSHEDRNMQRIVWRKSENHPIKEYTLNTVTYGTAPAAFIATKCLATIVDQIQKEQPLIANTIRNNFYMDDLIAGASSEEEILNLQQGVHNALQKYGFCLRKYSSNCTKLIKSLAPHLLSNVDDYSLNHPVSLLGITWYPSTDSIRINTRVEPFQDKFLPTKRIMLSLISRIFDPTGFLAPVLIRGKIMVQKLWLEAKSWDEPVSNDLSDAFKDFYIDLISLSTCEIPRSYFENASDKVPKCEIIAFSDASERACCVVVYLRYRNQCSFICSKTRVAPLKSLTIPRLELKAASLLVDIVIKVSKILNIELFNIHAFTDSTTVLCWLSQPPTNFKTFVSNRVTKIIKVIPFANWHYVATDSNPADLGTRGLSADKFLKNKTWFNGPEFLRQDNPFTYFVIPNTDVQNALEKRKINVMSINVVNSNPIPVEKISSYRRLINSIVYVLRFYTNCKKKVKLRKGGTQPSPDHALLPSFLNAHYIAIKCTQYVYYSSEIQALENNLKLKKSSPILSLTPFLDSMGILRVGGRLENSHFSFNKKHPIILPAKSNFCKTYVRFIHKKYFHANRTFLSSYFSSSFWFVGGCTNLFKHVIHSCITCTKFKAKTMSQIMAHLPAPRVNISHPFTHIGVDFAGPFVSKCVRHRTVKSLKIYAAVFVCLVTRAVHLEAVSDLSTDRFIASFQRFISRRGIPAEVFSDNGTNFQGSASFFECTTTKEKIVDFANGENFQWSFIPAYTPHQGGIWEAAVKSFKFLLKRITANQSLDFEEYSTLFSRIEAVLNSRPLCYTKNNEQGKEVITPAHFLIGRSATAVPKLENEDLTIAPSKRSQLLKSQILSFWNHWSKDYMAQVQTRNKWKNSQPNLEIGDLVFVKEPNSPPFRWPMGRVIAIYPDSQGHVRRADIKMNGQLRLRSITSLVQLPKDQPLADETKVFVSSGGGRMLRLNVSYQLTQSLSCLVLLVFSSRKVVVSFSYS